WIADRTSDKIYALSATGTMLLVAGTEANGDGGPARGAYFRGIAGVAINSDGDVYIADDDRIRRVAAVTGTISTFAGGGQESGNDLAPAANASLRPSRLAFDPAGNLVFLEQNRIRRIRAGRLETIISSLNLITSFAFDRDGNIFFSESYGQI